MTAITDARGEYRLTPLPIGTFAVEFTLSGFQTVRREGIILTASFVAKIDMQMKLGAIAETVTVSGASPVVDVVSTTSATRLTRETLDAIPSSRNGTVAFMGQAPGVRPQIDIGGDTITSPPVFHAFGQDNQPWQTIDGVVVSAAKSGTQGGIYWDYGNVEEAKVGTFGSPAEVPTRGVLINGIVKSGGNDFHGTGFYAFQNHVFQGNNIDAALNAQGISAPGQLEYRTDLSGDLGGRLIRNKLWFYAGGAAAGAEAGHAAVLPAERRPVLFRRLPDLQHPEGVVAGEQREQGDWLSHLRQESLDGQRQPADGLGIAQRPTAALARRKGGMAGA